MSLQNIDAEPVDYRANKLVCSKDAMIDMKASLLKHGTGPVSYPVRFYVEKTKKNKTQVMLRGEVFVEDKVRADAKSFGTIDDLTSLQNAAVKILGQVQLFVTLLAYESFWPEQLLGVKTLTAEDVAGSKVINHVKKQILEYCYPPDFDERSNKQETKRRHNIWVNGVRARGMGVGFPYFQNKTNYLRFRAQDWIPKTGLSPMDMLEDPTIMTPYQRAPLPRASKLKFDPLAMEQVFGVLHDENRQHKEDPQMAEPSIRKLEHLSQHILRLLNDTSEGKNLFQQVCEAMGCEPTMENALLWYVGTEILTSDVVHMKHTLDSQHVPNSETMHQQFLKLPASLKMLIFPVAFTDEDRKRMCFQASGSRRDTDFTGLKNKVTQMCTTAFSIYSMRNCNQRGNPCTPVQNLVGVNCLHHGVPDRVFKLMMKMGLSIGRDHARKLVRTCGNMLGPSKRKKKNPINPVNQVHAMGLGMASHHHQLGQGAHQLSI